MFGDGQPKTAAFGDVDGQPWMAANGDTGLGGDFGRGKDTYFIWNNGRDW